MTRMLGAGAALLALATALAVPGHAAAPREVNVHLRALVERGLPLDFGPTAPAVRVRLGEKRLVTYRVTNLSGSSVTLAAVRTVEPAAADGAVRQIRGLGPGPETLGPRQSKLLSIEFQIEPGLSASVAELTLGYKVKKVTP